MSKHNFHPSRIHSYYTDNNTSLERSLFNEPFKVFTVTTCVDSSLFGWVATTLQRGHTEGGTLSSLIITTPLKLFVAIFHLNLFF